MLAERARPDPRRAIPSSTARPSWRWSWRACASRSRNLRTFPWVREREEAGRLKLHGAYFAIADGVLHVCDEASGDFAPGLSGADAARGDDADARAQHLAAHHAPPLRSARSARRGCGGPRPCPRRRGRTRHSRDRRRCRVRAGVEIGMRADHDREVGLRACRARARGTESAPSTWVRPVWLVGSCAIGGNRRRGSRTAALDQPARRAGRIAR